jgi:hypothetical protein
MTLRELNHASQVVGKIPNVSTKSRTSSLKYSFIKGVTFFKSLLFLRASNLEALDERLA